jgi:DNA-binding CsgD family transcriptional regulator
VLDRLAALVDHSLVLQTQDADGTPRFRMLETLREFAHDQLEAAGEMAAVLRRMVAFYRDRIAAAQQPFYTAQMLQVVDRFEAERENLRAAFAWAVDQPEPETALALAGGLTLWFWHRGAAEGYQWAEQALALPGAERPTVARAQALLCAGWLAWGTTNDAQALRARLEEAAAIWRAAGERWWLAHALAWLVQARAWTDAPAHGPDSATGAADESVTIFRALGDRWGEGWALQRHAFMLVSRGQAAPAQPLAAAGVAIARAQGDHSQLGVRLNNLGFIAYRLGDRETARACFAEAEPLLRAADDTNNLTGTLFRRAALAFDDGDLAQAAACLREVLPLAHERGQHPAIGTALVGFAYLRALQGESQDAAWLLGGGGAWRDRSPAHAAMFPVPLEPTLARVREALDAHVAASLMAQGRVAPVEDLIARALQTRMPSPASGAVSHAHAAGPDGLSERELEVLRLLAAGKSNREIAEALVISLNTVLRHVTHILQKTGAANRTEAAAYAHRHGLAP